MKIQKRKFVEGRGGLGRGGGGVGRGVGVRVDVTEK